MWCLRLDVWGTELALSNNNRKLAVIYVLGYCFCSASLASLLKHLAINLPVVQIVFVAYFVSLVVVCVPLARLGIKQGVRTHHFFLQFLKGLFGVLQVGLMIYAYSFLPTANALILRSTAPLWIALICFCMFRKTHPSISWFALSLGFVGVLVFLHPDVNKFNVGAIYALLAGLSLAISSVVTQQLSRKGEDHNTTVFFSFLIPTVALSIWEIWHWQPVSWDELGLLIIVGFVLFLTVFFYVSAYSSAPATFVAPFSYLTFVIAAIFDVVFWHEYLKWLGIVGAIIILAACYMNVVFSKRHAKPTKMAAAEK